MFALSLMACHPGRILLHGGVLALSSNVVYADTWAWDGATRQRLADAGGPALGRGGAIACGAGGWIGTEECPLNLPSESH